MIGAISQVCSLPVTTAVTCPIMRIHPAIIAQAAATSAVLLPDRFVLGVGTGEALNEHIFGQAWPETEVRLAMLTEAVELIRRLWTEEVVSHHGTYYTVENARIYTRPEQPPPIYVSGFGPRAVSVAAQIGDGYVSVQPNGDLVRQFRAEGGAGKPTQAGMKACYAATREEAVQIAYQIWPNAGVPGELSQVLPTPQHFQQASQLVTPDKIAETTACGPDPEAQLQSIEQYAKAGFDELYVSNIGPHSAGLFQLYAKEVLPALRG